MSIQKYETDALQEHVDSTPILIARLDQWRHGVHIVQQYILGYHQVHAGITANLEKTLKSIGKFPTFGGLNPQRAANTTQLSTVFRDLQTEVNALLQRSSATANGIKTSVLPSLDEISSEIDKHYKTLRTQGTKGIKEVEKCRELTQKLIESLGQVTSSYGSRILSHEQDPLILHRKVESAVAEQVARENTQAEAALNVQKSFASLENHVVQTVRHTLANLASLNEGFDKSEYEMNTKITAMFSEINVNNEWELFNKANHERLVPKVNYQRDPSMVTFMNKSHPSTKPVLQGVLNRKGTVLKSYNQGFYIISPAGYLYQFKSAEPTQDSTPDISLYLPGCQVSKSSKVGKYVFKIVGRDSQKAIFTRHKYVFKANSPQELEQWYGAVARMTGNEATQDDGSEPSSPLDAAPSGLPQQVNPPGPPDAQMANTNLNTISTPAADTPSAASPASAAAAAASSSRTASQLFAAPANVLETSSDPTKTTPSLSIPPPSRFAAPPQNIPVTAASSHYSQAAVPQAPRAHNIPGTTSYASQQPAGTDPFSSF